MTRPRTPIDALLDNKLRGVPVFSDLSFQEHHLGRIELDAIDANWLLFADGFQNGVLSRGCKRVFDVAVGLLLTIVTLPLMLVDRRGDQTRQPRPGVLPAGEDGPARRDVHSVQIPQHGDGRRGGAASRNGRKSGIPGSPGSAPSSAPAGSMNCRNCSTCCAAK